MKPKIYEKTTFEKMKKNRKWRDINVLERSRWI